MEQDTDMEDLISSIIKNDAEGFFKDPDVLGALIFKKNSKKLVFNIEDFLTEKQRIKIPEKDLKEFKFYIDYISFALQNKEWITDFIKQKTDSKIKEQKRKQEEKTKKKNKPKLVLIQGGLSQVEKNKQEEKK